MAGQDSDKVPVLGIYHWQSSQKEGSEHFRCFVQRVGRVNHIRRLNHVRTKVDQLAHVFLADLLDFLVSPITCLGVTVEQPPIQNIGRGREIFHVLIPCENHEGYVFLLMIH